MFQKIATIMDCQNIIFFFANFCVENIANFKHAILTGMWQGKSSNVMLKKEGKERSNKILNNLCDSNLFQNQKPQRYQNIFQIDHANSFRQYPDQYLETIRPAMQQFDQPILVIGPIN